MTTLWPDLQPGHTLHFLSHSRRLRYTSNHNLFYSNFSRGYVNFRIKDLFNVIIQRPCIISIINKIIRHIFLLALTCFLYSKATGQNTKEWNRWQESLNAFPKFELFYLDNFSSLVLRLLYFLR